MQMAAPSGCSLSDVLPEQRQNLPQLQLTGLACDSRKVAEGNLFLACPGARNDGRRHIDEALRRGAAAVFAEASGLNFRTDRRVFKVPDLRARIGAIADRFYDSPSAELVLTGITGTDGKTSCGQWLAAVQTALGCSCGSLGTLGCRLGETLVEDSDLTTPLAIDSHRLLRRLRSLGAKAATMEVSSHALVQDRIAGLRFDIALFTNLGQDHLDYHRDREAYLRAKARLFAVPGLRRAVLNADDRAAQQLSKELDSTVSIVRYGLKSPGAEVRATRVSLSATGIRATVVTPWGEARLRSALIGGFNLSNLLAVVAALGGEQWSLDEIVAGCAELQAPPGRMQIIAGDETPTVVVDFAHTPQALGGVLEALRPLCRGQLWCVFGCGGDRDRGKRPAMGEIASRLADRVILTADNPRHERPEAIIDDILQGVSQRGTVVVECDRGLAIRSAIEQAGPDDWILIAGKGHEQQQEICGRCYPFDDVGQARLGFDSRSPGVL